MIIFWAKIWAKDAGFILLLQLVYVIFRSPGTHYLLL